MNKTFELENENVDKLIDYISSNFSVDSSDIPYGIMYKISDSCFNVTLIIYQNKKGISKVLMQGQENDLSKELIVWIESLLNKNMFVNHIGTDESGKGDFFGPLVVGGVFVRSEDEKLLLDLGVRDSKKISDKRIVDIFNEMKSFLSWDVVVIMPEKYNLLYSKFANINKLLSWAHVKVAENLLSKHPDCKLIVIDQFAYSQKRYEDAMTDSIKKCKVIQAHHGENDIAVAAASIVARYHFILKLSELGRKYDIVFPLGVNGNVKKIRTEFIRKYGYDFLIKVAKLNFNLI